MRTPLIKGGQGRTDEDLEADAAVALVCLVVAFLSALVAAILA